MEWLILRLHRQAVARLGPLTTDVSNWIRLCREYSRRDKELLEMVKRHKAEAREFNARLKAIRADLDQSRENLSRLESSLTEMSKSVSDV